MVQPRNSMRIAVLTNAYPPQARGGAGRIAALQVELLEKQGHDVHVWTTSLDWTAQPFWKRVMFHVRDLVWVHPYAAEIHAWQPEVLVTHNLTGAGFRTPRSVRAPHWVHVLHDVQLFYPLGLLVQEGSITVLQKLATAVRGSAFGYPDVVVSPTRWLLDAHLRRGWFQGVQTAVIPNPAPAFTGSRQAGWNSVVKIMFVGRRTADKGGEILRELQKTAKRPVEWKVIESGATPEEILEEMRTSDILLVPSQIEENQPTVILEAFACGLPVVASSRGGIPETLGRAGILVDSTDVADWWQGIERVLSRSRDHWSGHAEEAWRRHVPGRVLEALLEVLKSNKKI